jgi:hypothetical protein
MKAMRAPLIDGFAAARLASPVRGLQLLAVALLDRLGSVFGRPPRYGRPGELAIGATEDALFREKLNRGLTTISQSLRSILRPHHSLLADLTRDSPNEPRIGVDGSNF